MSVQTTNSVNRSDYRQAFGQFFDVPLFDLGKSEASFMGVFSPEPEIGAKKIGITDQFLDDATTYHNRYSNSAHFTRLFTQAFGAARIMPAEQSIILDLGSGSGANTILPCLELFRGCRIVATDLSPQLLSMLRNYISEKQLEDQVFCVCTDAMNNYFRPASFDVVVGAAILHHLLDPKRVLDTAYKALKPGGVALFFEPFEGIALLRVAFNLILDRAARETTPLDESAAKLLAAMILDWATRAGTDKTAQHFQQMDDKWLFTRRYIKGAARSVGFSEVAIVPHSYHVTLFRDYTISLLNLGAGLEADCLPRWAWDIISRFDESFSEDMKQDVALEATIVLRKGDGER